MPAVPRGDDVLTCTVLAYTVMADTVTAYIRMVYLAVAHKIMAYIAMARGDDRTRVRCSEASQM